MRVVLLTHGLPPHGRTGVETHVAALAAELGRQGLEVLVFAPRLARAGGTSNGGGSERLPHLAERREERTGYRVHWLELTREGGDPLERFEPPGVAAAFGELLDRERPDVAHVHHLERLGAGVVAELHRRGIPTVFTAHDHWVRCHRSTRVRPDLTRCETPGDPRACARCDRAQSFLNARERLGDYQAGVLPEQLSTPERERLAALLAPGSVRADPDPAGAAALVVRRALDGRRRALVRRFARCLAPSELVAEELERAGVAPERIVRAPYGIDRAPLESVPSPDLAPGRPLRFGYVGGLSKHKGVHVLLEAFGQRRAPAGLAVFGDSTDAPYVAHLQTLAEGGGARLHGGFDHQRLPEVLSGFDVLCVPSIWDENAPFVIREAFAAGRPVLASAVGALAESVRDGVDGLLLPPGDVEAWRAALDGLAAEPARAAELARGVRPPQALSASARELAELYAALVAEARPARSEAGEGLAHLTEVEARHRDVRAEPLDGLRDRALRGLERLRAGLAASGALGAEPAGERAVPALDAELQERARDGRREAQWLRGEARAAETQRAALAAEAEWLRSLLSARADECAWRRAQGEQAAGARAALEDEARWLRETLAAREDELDWLRGVARDHAEARAWYRRLAGLPPETGAAGAPPEAAPDDPPSGGHPDAPASEAAPAASTAATQAPPATSSAGASVPAPYGLDSSGPRSEPAVPEPAGAGDGTGGAPEVGESPPGSARDAGGGAGDRAGRARNGSTRNGPECAP